jgi:hypothetical protein
MQQRLWSVNLKHRFLLVLYVIVNIFKKIFIKKI